MKNCLHDIVLIPFNAGRLTSCCMCMFKSYIKYINPAKNTLSHKLQCTGVLFLLNFFYNDILCIGWENIMQEEI